MSDTGGATSAPNLTGQLLVGRYLVHEQLGVGGAAAVYRVTDQLLRVDRALKLLTAPPAARKHLRERMQAEARVMATLSHPNVLRIYDVGVADELDYVVMELALGGSLHQQVARRGPLPVAEACGVILQVLAALAAAHAAGVVHRDVKPQNVLLDGKGTALLADFGIALWEHEEELRRTRQGIAMGSLAFMAPEQRLDARSVTATADLYAVGASLYELLTASNPVDLFSAGPESPRFLGLEAPLVPFLCKACAQAPEDRFQDAREMAEALLMVTAELGLAPERPPDPSDPTRFPEAGSTVQPGVGEGGPRPTLTPSHTWTPAAATAIGLLFDDDPDRPPTAVVPPTTGGAGGADVLPPATPQEVLTTGHTALPDGTLQGEPTRPRWPLVLIALLLIGAGAWWVSGRGEAEVAEIAPEPPQAEEVVVPPVAEPEPEPTTEAEAVEPEPEPELVPEPVAEPEPEPVVAEVAPADPEPAPTPAAAGGAAGTYKGAYGGRVAELALTGSDSALTGSLTVRFGSKAQSVALAGSATDGQLVLRTVDASPTEEGTYTASLSDDGQSLSGRFEQALGGHVNTFSLKRSGP